MPASEFQFSLAHYKIDDKGLVYTDIQLPNSNFKWSTEAKEIGSVTDGGRFTSKFKEGQSEILVEDQRMRNNTAEGSINVVYPYRIEVKVKDVTNKQKLQALHAGDNAGFMQAYSLGLSMFDGSTSGN